MRLQTALTGRLAIVVAAAAMAFASASSGLAYAEPDATTPVPTVVAPVSPPVAQNPEPPAALPVVVPQAPPVVQAPAPQEAPQAPQVQPASPSQVTVPAPQSAPPVVVPSQAPTIEVPAQVSAPTRQVDPPPVQVPPSSSTAPEAPVVSSSVRPSPSSAPSAPSSQAPAPEVRTSVTTATTVEPPAATPTVPESATPGESPTATTTTATSTSESKPSVSMTADPPGTSGQTQSSEQSSPAAAGVPDTLGSTATVPNVPPVDVPAVAAVTPKAQLVADVRPDPQPEPVKVVEASQSNVQQLADVARSYELAGNDDHSNGHGNGNNHDGHQGPPPDPQGWECRQGPHSCNWDGWDHDDHNQPIFRNNFSFDLKLQWCDPNSGQFFELTIRAGTYRTVDLPRGHDFGYVVSGASSTQVQLNVAFGTWRGSHCDSGCSTPWRQDTSRFDFRFQVGNSWYPGSANVYSCGCNDYVPIQGRSYERIWINGTREVLGNWVYPPPPVQNQPAPPRYFVPVWYKETPVSPAYAQGAPPEFKGYGGLGDNPTGESSTTDASPVIVDHRSQYLWSGAAAVVVGGLGIWLMVRRSRRA